MRTVLSVVFSILIISLVVCVILTRRSNKDIKKSVAFLIAGLAIPVLGNLIIIITTKQLLATIGYYIYFLGMDTAIIALWNFTYRYCEIKRPHVALRVLIYVAFTADVVQYVLLLFRVGPAHGKGDYLRSGVLYGSLDELQGVLAGAQYEP